MIRIGQSAAKPPGISDITGGRFIDYPEREYTQAGGSGSQSIVIGLKI
jgi:hypothetical protein